MVLDTVAPRAALRGDASSSGAAREELLRTMQARAAAQPWGWQLPCPTCGDLVHGAGGCARAADDGEADAVLLVRTQRARAAGCAPAPPRSRARAAQPCRLVAFAPQEPGGALPPLYMRAPAGSGCGDAAADPDAARWELAAGVGPPALQPERGYDASQRGAGLRLPRAALRRFGVHSPPLRTDDFARDDVARLTAQLHTHLARLPPEQAARRFAQWLRMRPLYEHWAAAEATMRA